MKRLVLRLLPEYWADSVQLVVFLLLIWTAFGLLSNAYIAPAIGALLFALTMPVMRDSACALFAEWREAQRARNNAKAVWTAIYCIVIVAFILTVIIGDVMIVLGALGRVADDLKAAGS